jgi:hypothetical protein
MHEQQIDVRNPQLLQRLVARFLDLLEVRAPNLGNNEEIFTSHSTLGDLTLYGFPHLLLILIKKRSIQVAIANVKGVLYRS